MAWCYQVAKLGSPRFVSALWWTVTAILDTLEPACDMRLESQSSTYLNQLVESVPLKLR